MQVQLPTRSISDSAHLSTATFHVPPSAMAKLASTFISGLYSDPTRFAFELTANAVDAAGCPSKVKVQLPTRLEPAYVCEDAGPGMGIEFMMGGPYTEILSSTKDQDATKIGGWGVGRLSALAIADSYLIETRFNSYLVRKNTGGVPEIAHVGSSQVAGTRVTVPVPHDKVQQVQQAGLRALRWYSPAVACNLKVEEPQLASGSRDLGWAFIKDQEKPLVVMAGYEYLLDLEKIGIPSYETHKWRGLTIFAGPDFAEVVTNRQSLNYGDRTKANLKARLEKVKADLATVFEAELSQVATIFEAKRKLREANRSLPVTLLNVPYRGRPLTPYLDVGYVKLVQTKRRGNDVRALALEGSKYAEVPELLLVCDDDVKRPVARLNERGGIRQGTVVLTSAQADKLEIPAANRVPVADMPLPLPQPRFLRSAPVSWWLWSVGGSRFQETSLPVTSLPAVGYYVRFRNREPEGFTSRELSLMLAGFGRFQADVWGVPLSGRVPKGWVPLTKDLAKGEFERARTSLGNVDRLTALEKAWDVSDFDKIVQFLVRDTSPDPDHAEALRRLHALKAEVDTFGLDGNEIEAKLAFYDLPQASAHVLAPEDDPKLLHERLLVAKPLLRLIDRRWVVEQEECDILSSYLKS